MSILKITNITDNPEQHIRESFLDAFEQVEKEIDFKLTDSEKRTFIDNEIDFLVETAEETLGKNLLLLVDNYLVNSDFYAIVKDYVETCKEEVEDNK